MLGDLRNICLGTILFLLTHFNLAYAIPVGVVVTDFNGGEDVGHSVAIQTDGKIVVAGSGYLLSSDKTFRLARYNSDGRPDTSFGSGGKVSTAFASTDPRFEALANAVAIQSDGKIVVAGYSGIYGAYDFTVLRYNANGTLDTGFGSGGKAIAAIASSSDLGLNVAIQTDGKILVGGYSYTSTKPTFSLARFLASGRLDSKFSGGGFVTTHVYTSAYGDTDDRAYAMLLQSNGSIVLGGYSQGYNPNTSSFYNPQFALIRYTGSGALDSSFGTGGKLLTDLPGTYADVITGLAQQTDGKIVAVGGTMTRYNSNGSLDITFGSNGFVSNAGYTVKIQTGGNILTGGDEGWDFNAATPFTVARYNSNGAFDGGFGTGGRVTTTGIGSYASTNAIAIQADGSVVAAGQAAFGNTGRSDYAVARYLTNGTLDTHFGATADLAISMSSSRSVVKAGDTLSYTITVTNNGLDTATYTEMTRSFSLAVDTVSVTSTQAGCFEPSNPTGICNIPSGGSVTVTVVVKPQVTGTLTHSVSVDSHVGDSNSTNNSSTNSVTVTGSADLGISISSSPSPAKIGAPLTFTLTVTNAGPDSATQVIVDDALPVNIFAYSILASQGFCNGNNLIRCSLGTLASGASATINVVIYPNANGIITNSASVSSGVADPSTRNNSASLSATVDSKSDVAVSITPSAASVRVGTAITYIVRVTNNGPDNTDVEVRDLVPVELQYVHLSRYATTSNPDIRVGCSGSTIYCSVQNLGAGQWADFNISFTPTKTGVVSYSIATINTTPDPVKSNDSAQVSTPVTGNADLRISIASSPGSVVAGGQTTHTITVTNDGPDPAYGLLLRGSSPFFSYPTTIISSSISHPRSYGTCYSNSDPLCYAYDLRSGESMTATIVLRHAEVGSYSFPISVSSDVTDPNSANNSAPMTATATATPGSADLALTMSASPSLVRVGASLSYTLTVKNNGPDSVFDPQLTDILPAGVFLNSSIGTQGACYGDSSIVACSLGNLASGATVTVTITITPTSAAGKSLFNQATVSGSLPDPNDANNSASVITTVK